MLRSAVGWLILHNGDATKIKRETSGSVLWVMKEGFCGSEISRARCCICACVSMQIAAFVVDLPDDDCFEYYDLMVKEVVSQNRNFNFILLTFDIISQESL